MSDILQAAIQDTSTSTDLAILKGVLIRDSEELYLAWMLCALVPWAESVAILEGADARLPIAAASTVVRQGLKGDNKVTKVVENAALYRRDIRDISCQPIEQGSSALSVKRKREVSTREDLGMAIRRWGSRWRSNVIFSILVEVAGMEEELGKTSKYAF